MEEQITMTFTKNEAQVLLQLIDISVKSGGIQVAKAAVILFDKFEKAIDPNQAPPVAEEAQPVKAAKA